MGLWDYCIVISAICFLLTLYIWAILLLLIIYIWKKKRSDQVVEATGAAAGEEGSDLQRGVANVLLMCC